MDIEKSEHHDIVVGAGEGLASFFVPGELDRAFRENEWSVAEMVEVLTNIVRDSATKVIQRKDGTFIEEPITSPKEKMAAIQMLDKKAKEAMVLGGLIQKERLQLTKTGADGTTAEYNAEGMRLTQDGSSRLQSTLALLEGASKSTSDSIIDVEVTDERRDDECDGSGGGGGLLPRQPRGSDTSDGPGRTGSGDGPSSDGCGGDGVCGPVYGKEWTDEANSRWGQNDEQETTGGAEDERSTGIPESAGGSGEGEGDGGESPGTGQEAGCDSGGNKRPVVPGEQSCKRDNWWEPGIPRKEPDTDPGSVRDCDTAESQSDRAGRIERARKLAKEAAASYLERRKNSQRASDLKPGDGPGTDL